MKFATYINNNELRAALIVNDYVLDLQRFGEQHEQNFPSNMKDVLSNWESWINILNKLPLTYEKNYLDFAFPLNKVRLFSPIPEPHSCRDGYAFRQHVAAARRNRGLEMISEFDEYPVFYFTNHGAVYGEGDLFLEVDHFKSLDFELEIACVIGKECRNIRASEADNVIAGFMIMNDISARVLQIEEMKLNLGPAKGKDFASTFGPFLITPDELHDRLITTNFGNKYDLEMTAYLNGEKISQGNVKDMNWTFAELIERASYGATLLPGDIIGSGTVGTGCLLELNGTNVREAKEKGETYTPVWLQEGDEIELRIEKLGALNNRIMKSKNSYSLLDQKKMIKPS